MNDRTKILLTEAGLLATGAAVVSFIGHKRRRKVQPPAPKTETWETIQAEVYLSVAQDLRAFVNSDEFTIDEFWERYRTAQEFLAIVKHQPMY